MGKINKERIIRKLVTINKKLFFLFMSSKNNTTPVFIQGCGRSGTTMLLNIFIKDYRVETFGENDPRIAQNYMLKMDRIADNITNSKAKVVVMKPILNSFDANTLLTKFSFSKCVWMIRNFSDMVNSSLIKFGNDVAKYLKDYVLYDKGNNWISKGLPIETKRIISNLDTEKFTENDWMALVWWSVNRTIMIEKLLQNHDFILIKYERFVKEPDFWLEKIYRHVELPYIKSSKKDVHEMSVGKGMSIKFNPIVQKMCDELDHELTKS